MLVANNNKKIKQFHKKIFNCTGNNKQQKAQTLKFYPVYTLHTFFILYVKQFGAARTYMYKCASSTFNKENCNNGLSNKLTSLFIRHEIPIKMNAPDNSEARCCLFAYIKP